MIIKFILEMAFGLSELDQFVQNELKMKGNQISQHKCQIELLLKWTIIPLFSIFFLHLTPRHCSILMNEIWSRSIFGFLLFCHLHIHAVCNCALSNILQNTIVSPKNKPLLSENVTWIIFVTGSEWFSWIIFRLKMQSKN